jgi:hypothetical protein
MLKSRGYGKSRNAFINDRISRSFTRMQVLVSEQNITLLKSGMPVKVTLKSTNKEVSGTVSEISKSSKIQVDNT